MSREEYDSLLTRPVKLETPLVCGLCNFSFTNNVEFGFHSAKHNTEYLYTCHICGGYTHKSMTAFERHVLDHEGLKKFKCRVCDKPFHSLKMAYEHRNVHDKISPFECDICGSKFRASDSLKAHRNKEHYEILTGQKYEKYYCKLCDRRYKTHEGITNHNFRNHKDLLGMNPKLCEICGEAFLSENKLKAHLIKHKTQKPFKCSSCAKTFTQASTLTRHKLVLHNGTKPYTCNECGKQLSSGSSYSYHLKLHTGEKPHGCSICEKKFISKGNLRLHLKKFHKQVI